MNQETGTALYATEFGGYVSIEDGQFVWHSDIPDHINAQIGDAIPEDWVLFPSNEAARREAGFASEDVDDEYPDDDDEFISTTEVYSRAYAHFGNHELAREATELYPGDFI